MKTLPFFLASSLAISFPIPLVAPVTTNTLPATASCNKKKTNYCWRAQDFLQEGGGGHSSPIKKTKN